MVPPMTANLVRFSSDVKSVTKAISVWQLPPYPARLDLSPELADSARAATMLAQIEADQKK